MFGYIICNKKLSRNDRIQYRQAYCGLCNRLKHFYGNLGRTTLSYDLTFVDILYSAVEDRETVMGEEKCAVHPVVKHPYWYNDFTDYCADMNYLLYYYKCLDDYKDDGSIKARNMADKMKPYIQEIFTRHPQQCATIEACLNDLSQMEQQNVLNPDLPANCFGKLFTQLFTETDTVDLKPFGYHLGRFIYLLDAVLDLKEDLKNQRYNPLVAYEGDSGEMLEAVMADCMAEFEKLPVKRYREILENILYSGIWTAYDLKNLKKGGRHGSL